MSKVKSDPIILNDERHAIQFYDNRYQKGYMEEWPIEKKRRIDEIIRNLNLPKTGTACDFGCGNGEFTGVLKKALPKWDIYGLDISSVAIYNAKKRYSDCKFFVLSDNQLNNRRFDFLFTHHVLEHVSDVSRIWQEINARLNENASILHILPCGNPGSLEHNFCLLIKQGIDKGGEGRYFFEDDSHLRRLDTKQVNLNALEYGFHLDAEYYSNQFYGAVDWITLLSPSLICDMMDFRKANSIWSAFKLTCICAATLFIKIMRFPSNVIDHKRKKMKTHKFYLMFLLLLAFYPLSKALNVFIRYKSDAEWRSKKNNRNGSEMYLYYTRVFSG